MSQPVKYKAALIGSGYICEYHIAALRRAGVEIAGLFDIDPTRAAAAARKFGVPAFANLDAALKPQNVVHVLTPPDTHAAITLQALEEGCHVLVEKPLATDAVDCRRIDRLAAERGLQVCVNHSLLFDPQVRKALATVRRGKLGKIVSVDILRGSAYPPFGPGPLPPQYRTAGYPFRDIGVHALYLLEAFLGPIENVVADWQSLGGDPNLAFDEWRAQVRCREGMGQIQLSWNVRPIQSQMIIQGTRGVLRVDLFLMFQALRGSLPLPKAAERVINAMTDSIQPLIDVPQGIVAFLTKKILPYHGLQDLVAAFYDSLQQNKPIPSPVSDAVRVVEWTERVARAADADYAKKILPFTVSPGIPVLVTGASGGVGGAIVDRLLADGKRVRILVRRPPAHVPPNVEVALGDLGDSNAVDRAVRGAQVVIHAGAAMKGAWLEHERATIAGTQNVIDACLKYRVGKMIHISSLSVVDWAGQDGKTIDENSPLEPRANERGNYTRAKLQAERLVSASARQLGLPAVILRPGQIYGGKLPLLTPAVARKMGGKWLVLGDGELPLPLIHIQDVIEAVVEAAQSELRSGQIVQLVQSRQPTQNEVLRHLLGRRARIVRLPRRLVFMLGRLSELVLGLLKRQSPLSRYRLHSALSRLKFSSVNTSLLPNWRARIDALADPTTPAAPTSVAPSHAVPSTGTPSDSVANADADASPVLQPTA